MTKPGTAMSQAEVAVQDDAVNAVVGAFQQSGIG